MLKRSTLSNKVVAIKLAKLDPNEKRQSDFKFEVDSLSDSFVDEFTKQTFKMVINDPR